MLKVTELVNGIIRLQFYLLQILWSSYHSPEYLPGPCVWGLRFLQLPTIHHLSWVLTHEHISRIIVQARDQDYGQGCGSHLNGAKIGSHELELETSPGETMQREEEV